MLLNKAFEGTRFLKMSKQKETENSRNFKKENNDLMRKKAIKLLWINLIKKLVIDNKNMLIANIRKRMNILINLGKH